MVTWGEFSTVRGDLADAGRALFYQHGVGLAFLATVRSDGGPRLHPMCPLLEGEDLYAFIVASPKQRDLLRDGRYAMHSFPRSDNEDAFYLAGKANRVEDRSTREQISEVFVSERAALGVPPPGGSELLFRFEINSCLLTRTTGHGDPQPVHTIWHSSA